TVARAQAAGARVVPFQWVDDFSAARNAALALTQAPWRLVLDADEWLAEGGEWLRELLKTPPDFVGQVAVDSDYDDNGELRQAVSWISRLLPAGVHYEGRIHEQVVHGLPVQRVPVRVGHDGYRAAQQQRKGDRNRVLLQAALQATPDDAYLHYQLGKDWETHEAFEQAVQYHTQALALVPASAPWRHDLLTRLLFCLKKTGRHAEALQLAEAELPHHQASPDFFFALGDVLLDWAAQEPDRAGDLLPLIESSWLRCLEIGEAPQIEGAVQGRGSWLAAHNLAVFHQCLGQEDAAQAYLAQAAESRQQADESSAH
ncbi:MAG TPA: glycosyltransferase family 2 protein, partial [Candidatus Aquabacterium excrementipullorum]|nr:glycosyltransferase family 2 protein [Candidatus Aquabacterium excrementipullorum]